MIQLQSVKNYINSSLVSINVITIVIKIIKIDYTRMTLTRYCYATSNRFDYDQ